MTLGRYLPREMVEMIMGYADERNEIIQSYNTMMDDFETIEHVIVKIEITIGKIIRIKGGCPLIKSMVKGYIERNKTNIDKILKMNYGMGEMEKTKLYKINMKQNKKTKTINMVMETF